MLFRSKKLEGKLEVVAPYGTVEGIRKQLWKVALGLRMKNTLYKHINSVKISGILPVQIDGEIIPLDETKIKYDGEVEILTYSK